MIITGNDLYKSKTIIDKLVITELPLKTAFNLNKIIKCLNEVLEVTEKRRKEIIVEVGITPEDGTPAYIAPDDIDAIQAANERFSEYLSDSIEVDIDLLDVENFDDVKLTPGELATIMWLFE